MASGNNVFDGSNLVNQPLHAFINIYVSFDADSRALLSSDHCEELRFKKSKQAAKQCFESMQLNF